ncbi:MAG: hypothetical protein IJJ69_04120 [Oscillospiraceae bacterium]|nr:hypothetical protein [Oscillospiraceae bacterium]
MSFHIISQFDGENKNTTCVELDDLLPLEWLGHKVKIDGKNIEAKKVSGNCIVLYAVGDFVGKEVVLDEEDFDHNAKRFYMP